MRFARTWRKWFLIGLGAALAPTLTAFASNSGGGAGGGGASYPWAMSGACGSETGCSLITPRYCDGSEPRPRGPTTYQECVVASAGES